MSLGISYAHEAPFSSPLSEATQAEATRLAAPARAVLLSDVPFGLANLPNLGAALALRRAGKPVVCLQRPGADFAARDFTDGEGARICGGSLLAGGAAGRCARRSRFPHDLFRKHHSWKP